MARNAAPIFCICLFAIFSDCILGETVEAKVGGTVVLHCYSDTAIWYKPDGKEIVNDGAKYIVNAANNTLTVSKIGEFDIGKYVCQTPSENKTVDVQSPPYVKPLEKSVNLVQGNKLELVCSAWGNPKPNITWIKNADSENIVVVAFDRVSLGSDGKLDNAQLNITDVTYDDYGVYTCNATNSMDSASSSTKVRVKDKLAPLWPFIGICAEVLVLFLIILIYEKQKSKQNFDEDAKEEGSNLNNSNDHQDKEKVRLRK